MNRSIFDIQADFCKALASGSRLLILHTLRDHPMRVADIAQATELHPSFVSRQLGVLRGIGVVYSHRQGTELIYHLTDKNISKLCDLVQKLLADKTQRQSQVFEEDTPCSLPDCLGSGLEL